MVRIKIKIKVRIKVKFSLKVLAKFFRLAMSIGSISSYLLMLSVFS
jgi:hypothetical protein